MVENEEKLGSQLIASGRVNCSAKNPHIGWLRYTGGRGGIYYCECGMTYRKDGLGGLLEVQDGS